MSYGKNRSLLRLADPPAEAIGQLLYRARQLKRAKNAGAETPLLAGKNVALIFEKTSTRTRCSAEVACFDQGARCSYIAGSSSQLGHKESVADSARVLGRYYDAILWRGAAQRTVEILAAEAGVPVINGLSDDFHPLQMLADLLTMQEHSGKNLTDISFAYVGDARFNMGNSLLLAGALLGLDVRIAAPAALQPREEIVAEALRLAEASGGRIHIGTDPVAAGAGGGTVGRDLLTALPVGALDGTLSDRYVGTSAAGVVRAKTGSLDQTVSLTGTVVTADGRLLAYSVIIDGFPEGGMWSARTAMDNDLIVPLSGCGCRG